MEELNEIAIAIRDLSTAQLAEIQSEIDGQVNYTSPLARAKQTSINNTGKHNQVVLNKIKELRLLLITNPPS